MKGFQGGMAQFMKQANQMQLRMKKLQEELSQRTFESTSGGGAVQVFVNGDKKITKILIQPDVIKTGDVEMIQDLVLTASNEALKIATETVSAEMDKITGGLNIPGLF